MDGMAEAPHFFHFPLLIEPLGLRNGFRTEVGGNLSRNSTIPFPLGLLIESMTNRNSINNNQGSPYRWGAMWRMRNNITHTLAPIKLCKASKWSGREGEWIRNQQHYFFSARSQERIGVLPANRYRYRRGYQTEIASMTLIIDGNHWAIDKFI